MKGWIEDLIGFYMIVGIVSLIIWGLDNRIDAYYEVYGQAASEVDFNAYCEQDDDELVLCKGDPYVEGNRDIQ